MSLEIKKKELEYKRVTLGAEELEFRVFEREEDIKRLKHNIDISRNKLVSLEAEILKLKGE